MASLGAVTILPQKSSLQDKCQQPLGALSTLTLGLHCQQCWATIAKSGKYFGKKADADTSRKSPGILYSVTMNQ